MGNKHRIDYDPTGDEAIYFGEHLARDTVLDEEGELSVHPTWQGIWLTAAVTEYERHEPSRSLRIDNFAPADERWHQPLVDGSVLQAAREGQPSRLRDMCEGFVSAHSEAISAILERTQNAIQIEYGSRLGRVPGFFIGRFISRQGIGVMNFFDHEESYKNFNLPDVNNSRRRIQRGALILRK